MMSDDQCGDATSGYVCSLPIGHERSHQARDWMGSVSWGGWQGCLCEVPNTQAARCPKHGNALPVDTTDIGERT